MSTPAVNAAQVPATNFTFLSINMFKTQVGATKLDVLRNPNTSKLFVAGDNSANYNCQQDLDTSKPMSILVPDGDLTKACLINPKPGAEVIVSL